MESYERSRIESEFEVKCYLDNLKYALDEKNVLIVWQEQRVVDRKRDIKYTNAYAMRKLFPDNNPIDVLKGELRKLTVKDYMRTVKDSRFDDRSEMREFGVVYGVDQVYIKIRVELLGRYGSSVIFVMSFHFSDRAFLPEMFPYQGRE